MAAAAVTLDLYKKGEISVPINLELDWHKRKLQRLRWQLLNGRAAADAKVIPAAICWIDKEIDEIQKAMEG